MAETIHDGAVGGARHASAKPAPCYFPICLMKPDFLPVSVRSPLLRHAVTPSSSLWQVASHFSNPRARRALQSFSAYTPADDHDTKY